MHLIYRIGRLLPPKYRQFAKFLTVGGTSWMVDVVIFTVLAQTIMQLQVIMAKVISMTISTALSYFLNRQWSFNTRGGRRIPHEAVLFLLVNGLAFGINLIPLTLTHHVWGISRAGGYSRLTVSIVDWLMANVVGTFIAMFFRYWGYQRLVFPRQLARRKNLSMTSSTRNGQPRRTERGSRSPAPDPSD